MLTLKPKSKIPSMNFNYSNFNHSSPTDSIGLYEELDIKRYRALAQAALMSVGCSRIVHEGWKDEVVGVHVVREYDCEDG